MNQSQSHVKFQLSALNIIPNDTAKSVWNVEILHIFDITSRYKLLQKSRKQKYFHLAIIMLYQSQILCQK